MKDASRAHTDEGKAYRIFLVSLGAMIILLFAGIFLGIAIRNTSLVNEIILDRGRSLFQQIVLTLRNPALITREISEITALQDDYRFRITSLKPLNPGNVPDDFERRALQAFEPGALELWDTIEGPAGLEFRYMGALNTEDSCLSCHAVQGYQEGDVRGGISVSFPVEQVQNELQRSALLIIVAAILISVLTLVAIYLFVTRLRRHLGQLRGELELAASTDSLTGLYNRRYAMDRFIQEATKAIRTGTALVCAILDADDFKALNERYGHPVGDLALKAIALAMKETLRIYDTSSRYGGEEFLILFPGLAGDEAKLVCDRLRQAIAEKTQAALPEGKTVSVSIGLDDLASASSELYHLAGQDATQVSGQEAGSRLNVSSVIETMLKHADSALHKAKASGKDCCLVYSAQD